MCARFATRSSASMATLMMLWWFKRGCLQCYNVLRGEYECTTGCDEFARGNKLCLHKTLFFLCLSCLLEYCLVQQRMLLCIYRKCRNFRQRLIFVGRQHPRKLNPWKFVHMKNFSHSNYDGLLSPTKIYSLKNLTHKILRPRNFYVHGTFVYSLWKSADSVFRGE